MSYHKRDFMHHRSFLNFTFLPRDILPILRLEISGRGEPLIYFKNQNKSPTGLDRSFHFLGITPLVFLSVFSPLRYVASRTPHAVFATGSF